MVGGHGSIKGVFELLSEPLFVSEIFDNHLTALFVILLIVASHHWNKLSGLANSDEGAESLLCSHDLLFFCPTFEAEKLFAQFQYTTQLTIHTRRI